MSCNIDTYSVVIGIFGVQTRYINCRRSIAKRPDDCCPIKYVPSQNRKKK